jgi:hypothetical protein
MYSYIKGIGEHLHAWAGMGGADTNLNPTPGGEKLSTVFLLLNTVPHYESFPKITTKKFSCPSA